MSTTSVSSKAHRLFAFTLCALGATSSAIMLVFSHQISLIDTLGVTCLGLFVITILLLVAYPGAREQRGYLIAPVLLITAWLLSLQQLTG